MNNPLAIYGSDVAELVAARDEYRAKGPSIGGELGDLLADVADQLDRRLAQLAHEVECPERHGMEFPCRCP